MFINDKYAIDVIMALLINEGDLFQTPDKYLKNYTYEESRSITLADLRDALNDILKGGETE